MYLNSTREVLKAEDHYPSRIFPTPSVQQRQDPVVYPGSHLADVDRRHIDEYRINGFTVLHNLFAAHEIEALQTELARLRHDKRIVQKDEAIVEREDYNALRSLFRIHQLSPTYAKLARDPRLVNLARHILGSEVYIHQSRLNFKPGFSGKDFYWHSDFETWHTEDGMARMRALTVVITLSETNAHNGPLMLIPESHLSYIACAGETPEEHYKYSLQQQEIGTPDHASLRHLIKQGGIAAPLGPPGSVIVFDCNTMHGSNSNITPYPRSNLFFVYNSVENALQAPFSTRNSRPEYLSARHDCKPIEPAAWSGKVAP